MGGPSQATEKAQQNLANTQQAQSAQATQQSQQLFNTTFPGIQSAENYYKLLSSGDPNSIFKATAPAAENIAAQKQSVLNQINQNMPRGGAKDLAEAQATSQSGSQIGNLFTQAYTSSFPALANLGTSGVGLSVNELANSISGLGQASQTLSSLGGEQSAGKAATLGFLGSLGGAGASALGAV
jgi:hypothetical protein